MKKVLLIILSGFLYVTAYADTSIKASRQINTDFHASGYTYHYNSLQTGFQQRTFLRDSDNPPIPQRAALYSAILPGLGQAYNEKYYKVPIIYLAGAGLYWGFSFNNEWYKDLRDAYRQRIDEDITEPDDFHPDSDSDKPKYSTEQQLISAREFYRRNRDLFAIGLGLLYILNIVDAYVDAHLYEFDISEDLSMRINRNIHYIPGPQNGLIPQLGVELNF